MVENDATERRIGLETGSLTTLHWTAVALAAATGVIHLYLYVTEDWLPMLLAGVGFFGAIALLLVLPGYRKFLYPVGIVYTLAQVVGYLLLPLGPLWIAVLDKSIQAAFVLLLAYFTYGAWGGRSERRPGPIADEPS